MRFQVPQFIEVEDKLFGPLTFKQFIYVAGGAGACAVLFLLLPNFLAFIISIPIALFALALAFYKVNGKPFISVAESFLKYMLTDKLYLWKKVDKAVKGNEQGATKPLEQIYVPKLSESKLKELTWSLDIKETENPTTDDTDNNV